jgi:hypothetical protein
MPYLPKVAVLCIAVAASWCMAAEPSDLLAKLRAPGEVKCQPSHPTFCSNVHVTCVGPTRVATFPFQLRAAGTSGSIKGAGHDAPLDGLYDRATAVWDSQTQSLILRPSNAHGYVRIQPDSQYIFRYYIGSVRVMSLGRCE